MIGEVNDNCVVGEALPLQFLDDMAHQTVDAGDRLAGSYLPFAQRIRGFDVIVRGDVLAVVYIRGDLGCLDVLGGSRCRLSGMF